MNFQQLVRPLREPGRPERARSDPFFYFVYAAGADAGGQAASLPVWSARLRDAGSGRPGIVLGPGLGARRGVRATGRSGSIRAGRADQEEVNESVRSVLSGAAGLRPKRWSRK